MTSPQSITKARSLLEDAARRLNAVLRDEVVMAETPLEAQAAIESAADSIGAALDRLASIPSQGAVPSFVQGGPTAKQGQFLAFIQEYIQRNEFGIAPSHADLQRYFNLTAPSVNSMLIRLEERGFIRRVPGKVRAIEIVARPDWIPGLDRSFRV